MLKFCKSMGVLFLLTFSLFCNAQEAKHPESKPEEVQSSSSSAVPVMPAEVTFESSVGNVLFPHNVHLKFGCIACHHQIQAMELDTPHPDYLSSSWINCQDCHKTTSDASGNFFKCSDCHHSEPENIADETLSSKVVTHKSCWKCHTTGTGMEASEGCADCHVKE